MVIEIFNLKEFYIKKAVSYLLMLFTLAIYGFPFKFPHNTYNWIQKYDLPDYSYPVFIVLFIMFFSLMIGSFFNTPVITKTLYDLTEGGINKKGTFYMFNDMVNYKLEGMYEMEIGDKPVWKFTANFENKKLVLYLLLSHFEKKEFENYIKNNT